MFVVYSVARIDNRGNMDIYCVTYPAVSDHRRGQLSMGDPDRFHKYLSSFRAGGRHTQEGEWERQT